MDRLEKLAKLKKRDTVKSNQLETTSREEFAKILEATVGELKSSLGNGVALNNLDDLLDQLSVLQSFQKEVKDLRDAIKAIALPDSVKIEDLDELVASIKIIANKKVPKAEKLDPAPFIEISEKVTILTDKIISLKATPQGQKPEDYIPTRRVMKVGNQLLFDDSFYTGGSGGGTNSSTGDTQYADGEVRGTATGTLAMVDDGTNIQSLSGDSTGKLNVNNISGTVSLPTGASTETTLTAIKDTTGIKKITDAVTVQQSTASSLNAQVVGDVGSGLADSGNPLKIGAKHNTTQPTFTDGQRGDLQIGTRGSLRVQLAAVNSTTGIGSRADNTDATAVSATADNLSVVNRNTVYNGATWDRARTIESATNSVGTGIAAVGNLAQFDDVTPTSITENQFGNLRMSANRNLYGTIRDAAGNERGANVTAGNALVVDGSAVTQPISGTVAVTNTDLTSLLLEMQVNNGGMAQQVDDTGSTLYQGWAEPGSATSGALWRIRRVVSSGTPTDTAITFADGNRNFDNIWDNRAALSYS